MLVKSTDRKSKARSIGGRAALACAFAGLGAVLCVLLTAISAQLAGNLVSHQIRHRLRDIITVSASRINGDIHTTLTRPVQEGGAAYREIQSVLQEIQRSVADLHYVYTMREAPDGGIMFVVDEETNEEEIAHLGERYEDAGPDLRTHFASLTTVLVESEVYTDSWGSWLSGYAPFYDSEGQRAGVLGMDISADDIAAARWRVLRTALWLLAAILPVCMLLGWLLAGRIIVPVRNLARDARQLIQWPNARFASGSCVAEIDCVNSVLKAMRHLLNGMTDTVVATDLDGKIVYVNEANCVLLKKSREELVGQPITIFSNVSTRGVKQSDILRVARESGEWEGEVVNVAEDGSEIIFYSRVSLLHDDTGTPIGILGVSSDHTERKRAEEERLAMEAQLRQSQKLEAVGQLAGGVAHDFNNLLMGIMNYVELCRDGLAPDHPIREWLDEIMSESQRSADLIRQLLAFARKQTIAPKVLDLNDAVAGMLKMLQRLIGEDIDLTWKPGPDLRSVKMDPSQVDQLLANLCINARDSIDGGGKITIETGNVELDADYCCDYPEVEPGYYVMVAVSDTGCGMERETLEHIFEPFFTTKGLAEGTGLGLATVHGIVKQNNGHINVYSEPDKGTTFRIYLPHFAEATETAAVASMADVARGGSETILLVEDEKSIRVTSALFLKNFGYTVLVAEDPETALRLAVEHPERIHLLITDMVMPGMNGKDLADRLSGEFPDLKCLFMSGYTVDVIENQGVLEEGINFLSKPITRDALALKVREVLDGE